VRDLIERRATERPDLAIGFAEQAVSREGVHLRAQESKNEATYFQVRSSTLPYVVAYANVFARELKVDFRLPDTHEPYGVAKPRPGNAYGLGVILRDQGQMGAVLQLLDDALSQPPSATPATGTWTEALWFADLEARGHGHLAGAAREILAWAGANDLLVRYRASGKVGGIDFMPKAYPQAWLFSMWSNGTLIAENNHLRNAPGFSAPEQRGELLRALNRLPGMSLNEENTNGYD
jgi:hypothetical protein